VGLQDELQVEVEKDRKNKAAAIEKTIRPRWLPTRVDILKSDYSLYQSGPFDTARAWSGGGSSSREENAHDPIQTALQQAEFRKN
jgi:hypothetical protein